MGKPCMKKAEPGDLVFIAPDKDYAGYMFSPALYIEEVWEDAGEGGQYATHIVLFNGKVFRVPARTHKVEKLYGKQLQYTT